ncbi:ATP-binding protein [Myxacorys almedinensis]|uniref:histidine kinase n=1 Tax=Myxacorys almedinensis A TaxID=2690445 RepID=A0A8J7Z372_9CYAN|nr:PAS domain-containing sensor histidine kinase [Myxacorys almedinensis A]
MSVLWFLLGLAIGSAALLIYRLRLSSRLKQLTHALKADQAGVGFSLTSQLTLAIAHHQELNHELEQRLETWKQIVNAAPIGFLQVDEENQLLWHNPEAYKLLNFPPGVHHPPRLLLELVRSYELDSLIEKTRNSQQPRQRDWIFYPAAVDTENVSDPRPMPLRGTAFPLAEGNVGVFLENRQEALTLTQQRDRWASDVAHELRTPLTSIRLVAETLQSRLELPLRDWVDRLLHETIRLSMLVQELLDLGQLEMNPSQRLRLKEVDLIPIIYAAWNSLDPLATEKQVYLSHTGLESAIVKVDEARFHRVFLNLFDNSIKYSPIGQPVQVQIDLHESGSTPCLKIEVIDQGEGFPEQALTHVFERFYRADPSRSRPDRSCEGGVTTAPVQYSSGSGLGLAIVRQIIEAHQGSVRAKNHPKTGGACVQIVIPFSNSSLLK